MVDNGSEESMEFDPIDSQLLVKSNAQLKQREFLS